MDTHELGNIAHIISGHIELVKTECDGCGLRNDCDRGQLVQEAHRASNRLIAFLKKSILEDSNSSKGDMIIG